MNAPSEVQDSDCGGFYHWPPVWIGSPPTESGAQLTVEKVHEEVFAHTLACRVRFRVSKAGLFVFDFAQWAEGSAELAGGSFDNWQDRVFARMRFLNLFLACFYTSLYRLYKTATAKLFIDYTTYIAVHGFDLNAGGLQCDLRNSAMIRAADEYHHIFKPTCTKVPPDVVQSAADMTDKAMADEARDTATLAELLLHSFHLHESGKYEASHIAAWTIVERCLNDKWQTHLQSLNSRRSPDGSAERFISSNRRQKLTGRDFTASIISEFLSLSDLLSFENYKVTCRVRQARNDWLHRLHAIGPREVGEAIRLAQLLLRDTELLDVGIPFEIIEDVPIALVPR